MILRDNYPREDEVYLMIVYTGYSAEAGTTANVCVQLHGSINTSRVSGTCILFLFIPIKLVPILYSNWFRFIGWTTRSFRFCSVSTTIGLLFVHRNLSAICSTFIFGMTVTGTIRTGIVNALKWSAYAIIRNGILMWNDGYRFCRMPKILSNWLSEGLLVIGKYTLKKKWNWPYAMSIYGRVYSQGSLLYPSYTQLLFTYTYIDTMHKLKCINYYDIDATYTGLHNLWVFK